MLKRDAHSQKLSLIILPSTLYRRILGINHINASNVAELSHKKGFTEYFYLENHMSLHTGGKPYTKCTQCNEAYIYNLGLIHLKSHSAIHHMNVTNVTNLFHINVILESI